MRARSGFALMTVMWLLVAVAVVGLAGTMASRDAVDAARNRADLERATWRANDCLERARAAIDEALAEGASENATARIWRALDRHVAVSPLTRTDTCTIALEAVGARLDVNAASDEQLRALFRSMGSADAESLADRLLDWRDPDDEVRPRGAESGWYVWQSLPGPRNGSFADVRELAGMRGDLSVEQLETVLTVEPGRISINHASLSVLALVPGFTPELLARIALERERGRDVSDLLALSAFVSRPSADSLMAHYPEIAGMTTVNPDAWILTARGWVAGVPEMSARVDARIVLDNASAAVVRRRTLP